MASETPKTVKRGFGPLPCILCGAEGTIRLDLDDVANLTCAECEESFTPADVRAFMAKWAPVLAWIETAPVQ